MASQEHLHKLRESVKAFNSWRRANPTVTPDLGRANLNQADLRGAYLRGAYLRGAHLCGANLNQADLREANLRGTYLIGTNFIGANLSLADLNKARLRGAHLVGTNLVGANLNNAHLGRANLSRAILTGADLIGAYLRGGNLIGANLTKTHLNGADLNKARLNGANLSRANLTGANLNGADLNKADLRGAHVTDVNLSYADLSGANLSEAILERAMLVETNIEGARLSNCRIYGISVWALIGQPESQADLVIVPGADPLIAVDSLEVAQFLHLLLHSERLRRAIDTITSNVVLILGRFKPRRKAVLDAIRDKLREYQYIPLLLNFDSPNSRRLIETVSILAHLARFVIVDFSEGKIVYKEVPHIWKHVMIPIKPLLLQGSDGEIPITLLDLKVDTIHGGLIFAA